MLWHNICSMIVVKKVLIVDDEKPFLLSLADGLAAYAKDFEVITALNGKEAVKVLDSTGVDLVVTDLRMPKMDGFELLAHMSGSYPDIPVIVMTAYGTPEIEERLQAMGTFYYLEKPLEFTVLADKIVEALGAISSPDHIHGISLAAFLQLLEMENKTCTLTITSGEKEGHLYFVKGELMQAEAGKVKGEGAALDIVTWENVAIEIQYSCAVKKKSIGLPLAEILREGFRIKDEKGSVQGKEEKMDVKKINALVEEVREDLGDALLSTDIWTTADGTVVAGVNSNPKAAALMNQVAQELIKALTGSKFPSLEDYYILDLLDGKMMICLVFGDYQWGMLLDTEKVQLGLLLSVVTPKAIAGFKEAVSG
jgi:CheY-like chemotaxis protein